MSGAGAGGDFVTICKGEERLGVTIPDRRSRDASRRGLTGQSTATDPKVRLRRLKAAARSGLKRYPRALWECFSRLESRECASQPGAESMPDVSSHALAASWLGHGTVFLRLGELNILMDPVFSERIGLSIGRFTLGLSRLAPAPVAAHGLPRIDLLLISHAHFDHLDKPSLRQLASEHTTVVTARRTRRLIPAGFGQVIELDWDQGFRFRELELTALRPAHWGARTAIDRRRGYNSYMLRGREHGVLLAGDTALTDAFNGLGNLDLAVMGIGAYEPWTHAHATPEQTWSMFRASGAERLLPVHHSTFPLGDEHVDEPMERLMAAAGDDLGRILALAPGAIWSHEATLRPGALKAG
jgi:L-ascorbate metabolism protein UlaG (beta-lactamase superfamily)